MKIQACYIGNLLLVSHGGAIAAGHHALIGDWIYVGQCSISKIVPKTHLEYHAELSDHNEHLSDRSNLHGRDQPGLKKHARHDITAIKAEQMEEMEAILETLNPSIFTKDFADE